MVKLVKPVLYRRRRQQAAAAAYALKLLSEGAGVDTSSKAVQNGRNGVKKTTTKSNRSTKK